MTFHADMRNKPSEIHASGQEKAELAAPGQEIRSRIPRRSEGYKAKDRHLSRSSAKNRS